jgi:hypothetical protein
MRGRLRPRYIVITYRGIPHRLDLDGCERALLRRQIEGDFVGVQGLANAAGISRSTASRFFCGRPASLSVTLAIFAQLRLAFDDVVTPIDDGSET